VNKGHRELKSMKKRSVVLMLILTAGAMLSALTTRPVAGYIDSYRWLGTTFYYDTYWDQYYVTVFPENTIATLSVVVYNSAAVDLNVSAIKVLMDWNINYTSSECSVDNPIALTPYMYHTFSLTFTVPDVTVASNLARHGYTIYVEQVNATTGNKQASLHDRQSDFGFIVYSTTQLEAQRLYEELDVLMGTSHYFQSSQAQALWDNGTTEFYLGESSHWSGDFSAAKAHYEAARSLLYQALSTELSYEGTLDNNELQYSSLQNMLLQAQIDQYKAQAAYYNGQAEYYKGLGAYQQAQATASLMEANASLIEANASLVEANAAMRNADAQFALLNTQGYAWILFGFGFIVFGIAAVVWAFRRTPKPQQPPA
jgi:hypothetical protein